MKAIFVQYIESFFCGENMIIIDIVIQDFYLPMLMALFKIVRLKRNLHKIHVELFNFASPMIRRQEISILKNWKKYLTQTLIVWCFLFQIVPIPVVKPILSKISSNSKQFNIRNGLKPGNGKKDTWGTSVKIELVKIIKTLHYKRKPHPPRRTL